MICEIEWLHSGWKCPRHRRARLQRTACLNSIAHRKRSGETGRLVFNQQKLLTLDFCAPVQCSFLVSLSIGSTALKLSPPSLPPSLSCPEKTFGDSESRSVLGSLRYSRNSVDSGLMLQHRGCADSCDLVCRYAARRTTEGNQTDRQTDNKMCEITTCHSYVCNTAGLSEPEQTQLNKEKTILCKSIKNYILIYSVEHQRGVCWRLKLPITNMQKVIN